MAPQDTMFMQRLKLFSTFLFIGAALLAVRPSSVYAVPGQITGLAKSSAMDAQAKLKWTAPGAEGYVGNVTGGMWKIACSSCPTSSADTAEYVILKSTDYVQGSLHALLLTGLKPLTSYYCWIKARNDQVDGWSVWSDSIAFLPSNNYAFVQNVVEVAVANMAWGDYDDDGDLDLAYTSDTGPVRIHRNNNYIFTNIGAALPTILYDEPELAWGDYDSDGDLDLGVVGFTGSVYITNIYRNKGDGTFTDIGAGVTGTYCDIAWGDYDNDGDLDLAITGGIAPSGSISRIYKNTSGSFVDIVAGMTGLTVSALAWGDYDNDGDLDLVIAGDTGSGYLSRIYKNNATGFTMVNAGFKDLKNCEVAWGDYDNDGDLDFGIDGYDSSLSGIYIYRNDTTSFTSTATELFTNSSCYVFDWVDFDSDGDLDFAVAQNVNVLLMYRNLGPNFTYAEGINTSVYAAAWGQCDGNSDVDVAVGGTSPLYYYIFKFVSPDYSGNNTAPSAPSSNYSSTFDVAMGSACFRWGYGTDAQTPEKGLYYEIRAASHPITNNPATWIISPSTGIGATPFLGNYLHGYCVAATTQPGVNVGGLVEGTTYYWQVRSIDTSLKKSNWGPEQTYFCVKNPGKVLNLTASNVETAQVKLSWTAPGDDNYTGNVTGGAWRIACSTYVASTADGASYVIDISTNYTQGTTHSYNVTALQPFTTYYFWIKARDENATAWSVWSASASAAASWCYAVATNIPGMSGSTTSGPRPALAWGDYDNDGDLDLAAAGMDTSASYVEANIFRNNSGILTNIGAGLLVCANAALAWGDYDSDGDLDLALSGAYSSSKRRTRLYQNTAGSFALVTPGFTEVQNSALAWGDYDNDGDVDLISAGYTGAANSTVLYKNTSGSFAATSITFTGVTNPSLAWGDYDNDGDLDLLLVGDSGAATTKLYKNTGGSLTDTGITTLTAMRYGQAFWGDYDNDGSLDLAAVGSSLGYIYRGGNSTFTDIGAGLPTLTDAALDWGDYDNNGYLDLAVCGYNGSSAITRVYKNSSGSFTVVGTGVTDVRNGFLAWADLDTNGDLELAVAGNTSGAPATGITRIVSFADPKYNNTYNTVPSAPSSGFSGTYSTVTGSMTFKWDYGSDTQTTQQKGLYYEVRVATNSITDSLTAWTVSPSTGAGAWPFLGNYSHGFCMASSTQPGANIAGTLGKIYYWQVRTIDTGFKKSAWSTLQTSEAESSESAVPGKVTGLSAVTGQQVQLTWTAPGDDSYAGNVYGGLWKIACSSNPLNPTADTAEYVMVKSTDYLSGARHTMAITGLQPLTTYYFWIKAQDEVANNWSVWSDSVAAVSGSWIDSGAIFTNKDGAVAWGDYDNDGDYDFVVAGASGIT